MEEPSFSGLFTPGELITDDPMWMRGHGTYTGQDRKTYSSVAGKLQRVNKLLTVKQLNGRYDPLVGDHIVGRITEVGNRKWSVELGATQDASLQLGSVNLPGGVLRRKSDDDELNMREFLKEGDLLNAEVQMVYQDGGCALHTRSLRYGKLRNGMLCTVPPNLILRQVTQSHDLEGGVEAIIGANGYIWLRQSQGQKPEQPTTRKANGLNRLEQDSDAALIFKDTNDEISIQTRQTISRYYNCIQALADCEMMIFGSRLREIYEASLVYADAAELLKIEVKQDLCRQLK